GRRLLGGPGQDEGDGRHRQQQKKSKKEMSSHDRGPPCPGSIPTIVGYTRKWDDRSTSRSRDEGCQARDERRRAYLSSSLIPSSPISLLTTNRSWVRSRRAARRIGPGSGVPPRS